MMETRPISVAPIDIPITPRLRQYAEQWAKSHKPHAIESPGPGQISVWNFPRPPAVERVLERVEVYFAGQRIASTDQALRVCETASPPTYYIPPDDVAADCVQLDTGNSWCEWKGDANYYALVVEDQVAARAAWGYTDPHQEYALLAGFLSFYPGRVDRCTVGDRIVGPQPGRFYGGWVTDDLAGPFKGAPGSQSW